MVPAIPPGHPHATTNGTPAGGTVLAEDDNSQPVAEDTVVTATVNYTYNAGLHAGLVGQALEIRLLSKGLSSGQEIAFDDVKLTLHLPHPVADAGGPYTVAIPTGLLALNGSGSMPSTGSTLSLYEWDLNHDGAFGDVTGVTPATLSYAELTTTWGMTEGANTIKLRVTDATTSETATATTDVTLAYPTTFNGIVNTDWNTAGNWDHGLPTGSVDMVIAAGKTAQNSSSTPATSTGSLTLNAGAIVRVPQNAAAGEETVVTAPTLVFNGGTLDVATQETLSFRAISLTGSGKFTASSNSGDSRTRNLNNLISGGGLLTIDGRNNQIWNIGTDNSSSFSGGLTLTAIDRYEVRFNASGSAGTGDVTVTPRPDGRSAVLVLNADHVFADTAKLTLNGKGAANSTGWTYGGVTRIDMKTFSDTVDRLVVDHYPYPAGTYGRIGTAATVDFEMNWIAGDGVLTVANAPADSTPPTLASIVDNAGGGPVIDISTVTFTVSFSEPMNAATIGLDDFEDGGTSGATIVSVNSTASPDIYTVVATPASAGTLILQVKQGAVPEDLFGNRLVTTSALPDDLPITVNPEPQLAGQLGILDPAVFTANFGKNPATGNTWQAGDTYRFVFTTSAITQATSADIATYNALVQGLANASSLGIGAAKGATWKALVSTATDYARDNTATNIALNGTGEAIYLLDGKTKVFNNYVHMWSTHSTGVVINRTEELGTPFNTDYGSVWSGIHRNAYPDPNYGTASANDGLGAVDGTAMGGLYSGGTGTQWIWRFGFPTTKELPIFALSMPLTVVSTAGGNPYDTWSAGAAFDADANGDGVDNGLAFLLGAANPNANALGLLPTVDEDGSGGLVLSFSMLDAASRGTAKLYVEHSRDLGVSDAWTSVPVPDATPDPQASDVHFTVSGSGLLSVTATIQSSEAGGTGKLFGRLVGAET